MRDLPPYPGLSGRGLAIALAPLPSVGRGLILDAPDELAEVPGLVITVGVRKVPRPSPKGRRPAKENADDREDLGRLGQARP